MVLFSRVDNIAPVGVGGCCCYCYCCCGCLCGVLVYFVMLQQKRQKSTMKRIVKFGRRGNEDVSKLTMLVCVRARNGVLRNTRRCAYFAHCCATQTQEKSLNRCDREESIFELCASGALNSSSVKNSNSNSNSEPGARASGSVCVCACAQSHAHCVYLRRSNLRATVSSNPLGPVGLNLEEKCSRLW